MEFIVHSCEQKEYILRTGGKMKLFLGLIFALLITSCQTSKTSQNPLLTQPIQCQFVRAAFDIGSGETKLKVAKVDACKTKIEVVLLESKRDVNYKGDLQKSKNNTFSDAVLAEGKKALKELKDEALVHKPSEFTSVATAAFRDAKNAKSYVESLNRELGLKIQIITQQEEGILGFYAARSKATDLNPEKSVVWDIGGGSQQLILQVEPKGRKQFLVYEGKVASTSFKKHIVEKIQKRSGDTPNPIKENQVQSALAYAKDIATRTVKKEIKTAIANDYKVYGIGGVHNYSIKGQLQTEANYSSTDLDKIIQARQNKTDEELGNGSHVSTDTTNPILVKGFVDALGIKEVTVLKVNLADGLLINHKYWTP